MKKKACAVVLALLLLVTSGCSPNSSGSSQTSSQTTSEISSSPKETSSFPAGPTATPEEDVNGNYTVETTDEFAKAVYDKAEYGLTLSQFFQQYGVDLSAFPDDATLVLQTSTHSYYLTFEAKALKSKSVRMAETSSQNSQLSSNVASDDENSTFMGISYWVPSEWKLTKDDDNQTLYYYPTTSELSMVMVMAQPVKNQTGAYDLTNSYTQESYLSGIASGLDNYIELNTTESILGGITGIQHDFVCEISGVTMQATVHAVSLSDMLVSIGLYYSPSLDSTETEQLMQDFNQLLKSINFDHASYSQTVTSPETTSNSTTEQSAALNEALDYLEFTAFSHSGLVGQLEYEGFSTEDATWAADHCGADWNEQAAKKAESYLDTMPFSYTGLIDQLEFEGFTADQATYGVDSVEVDWNEQAAKKAQSYLDLMEFSRQELIDQLVFDGFTQEQAEYGVTQAGM